MFVRGCVNVITGDFVDSQTDMIVPGVEPFVLQRCYHKLNAEKGSLGKSWNLNFDSKLVVEVTDEEMTGTIEHNGGRLSFLNRDPTKPNVMPLNSKYLAKGVTNTGSGHISGRTNIKNINMIWRKHAKNWMTWDGARVIKHFSFEEGSKIVKEVRPAGNRVLYSYEKGKLQLVKLANSVGNAISSIRFHKAENLFNATAGLKKVNYHFKHNQLVLIESSDVPTVAYSYKSATKKSAGGRKYHFNLIEQKSLPEGRYLKVEYKKSHRNDDLTLAYRVSQLIEPAGPENASVTTYTFEYLPKHRTTHVYDALNHKTSYYYDKNDRLQCIDKLTKDGNAYCRDHLYWQGHQLAARLIIPLAQWTLAARTYAYDPAGNITMERLYGNLSGKNTILPEIALSGTGVANGCEYYEKRFVYSEDGLNLLLHETDGTYEISYRYCPGNDLLSAKIYRGKNQTYKREFFEYNGDLALTKHVVDNGTSENQADLSSVTQRYITYYVPKTSFPVGLPEIVEDKCFDFASGQERLIKKHVNEYDDYGRVKSQTHFDNQANPVYTLFWDYDAHGNVTKEIDPIGRQILRKYDLNNNLIEEQGPNPDLILRYEFDAMNRLVKQEEIHKDITLCTNHRYDLTGNRIATVDPYGQETLYEYDEFHRLIKTTYPQVLDEYGVLYSPVEKKEYDWCGNVTASTDGRSFTTHNQYNIRNQIYKTTYPNGLSEEKIYNLDGTVYKSTNTGGTYTIYNYDFAKRPIKKETYSSDGVLVETTSANYDAFHLLSETDAVGHVTSYEYTPEGWLNCKRKGDAVTNYIYDNLGRLKKTIQAYGSNSEEIVIHAQDYDFLNRIVEERTEDFSEQVLTRTAYRYDLSGNKSQIIQYTSPNEKSVTDIVYDTHNDPIFTTDPEGKQTVIHRTFAYYNEHGQHVPFLSTEDPKGNIITTAYDTHGRIAKVTKYSPHGHLLEQQEKRYDASGNPLAIINLNSNKKITTLYKHDEMNRIALITEAWGTPEKRETKIEYCALGLKTHHIKPDKTVLNYSYDALGRLTAYNDNFKTFAYEYHYDANYNPLLTLPLKNHPR